MIINVIKIFLPTTLAFVIGIGLTPFLTRYMYEHQMWKKKSRGSDEGITNDRFKQIHNATAELSTPRIGGVIIWLSVLVCISLMWIISRIFPSGLTTKLDFYSRSQTLVPLVALLIGAAIGLVDDLVQIRGNSKYTTDKIIYRYLKIASVIAVALAIGGWFYFKLGINAISVPFSTAPLFLGIFFVPFFILIMLAVFSTSTIDGLDGLAGGVLAVIFGAYAIIAFGQNQIDVAAFCGVITGSIMAFLWFNIPPARFYMGETGILGLTVVLTVIAFLTDTVLILPLIALPLVATTVSVLLQIGSYKFCHKKRVFKIAPLHHHFRAMGWSSEKVVMRYWIISVVSALLGVVVALISK